MNAKLKWALAFVVLAVGVAVFSLGMQSFGTAPANSLARRANTQSVEDRPAVRAAKAIPPTVLDPVADAADRSTARGPAEAPLGLPDAAQLGRTMRDTIASLDAETPDEFFAVLEAQGVSPPVAQSPEVAQIMWQVHRSLMVHAEFDLDRLRVVNVRREGRYEPPLRPHFARLTAGGAERRPFLNEPGADNLPAAEFILPGRFTASDGQEFDADMVFGFTYNRAIDTWVLTERRLVNFPTGVPTSGLPL